MTEKAERAAPAEAVPEVAPSALAAVVRSVPVRMFPAPTLGLARALGNQAFGAALARQTAPAAAPAQTSPEERIVNMHSLLEDSVLGSGTTQLAQANAILREFCAPRSRHVSYVTVDATGGLPVKPMLTLTAQQTALRFPPPEAGRAPLMFDPGFFAGLTVADFQARVAEVRAALEQLVQWRFERGVIDAQDLQDPGVVNRLRDLRDSDAGSQRLRELQGSVSDQAVRDHITQILSYSTPLPHDAAMGTSSTTLQINGVNVTILPDAVGGSRNETSYTPSPATWSINATTGAGGTVTGITGVPSSFTFTIQTTYATGTGNADTQTSAYGRGTTPADQAAGNTSLRFHESRHGNDFLAYLQANPQPVFGGTVGMPVAAFQTAMTTYSNALRAWIAGMDNYSKRQTDCVGSVTIDGHHQGQAGYTLVCTP